ncbi:hypothetical protein [Bradyrhizobium sp. USDA 336]|uniref:hypothetical protein n=1 Tax=Bradyrhizobium sp. USDA 336 TaxID=3156311 RepID=UPI0038394207
MSAFVDSLLKLVEGVGAQPYGNAELSEIEHAIQSAVLARNENAADHMVAAALLHDLGHLVVRSAVGLTGLGVDNKHEAIAAAFLSGYFPPSVTEPIRLHVSAKRYLFTTDEGYRSAMTPVARRSMERQGGGFTREEAREFERLSFAQEAIRLRRWDDAAMIPGQCPGTV